MKKQIKSLVGRLGLANIVYLPIIFCWIFPIKNNRIIFQNFKGKGYSDSPKYIAEKLRQTKSYDLYWITKGKQDKTLPTDIKSVKIYSLKYFYILATSKIWISNVRFELFCAKRKKQFYIQTWHGGLALKKLEYDSIDNFNEYYKKVMKRDNKRTDIMVSNSDFCTKMYRKSFRYNGKIIVVGTPRNDVLVNDKQRLKEKVYSNYSLDQSINIALYAPTYRDDYSKKPYDIDLELLHQKLVKETGEKWVVFVKLHHFAQDYSKNLFKYNQHIKDATTYPDIQELICASSLVITDYSSVMFDSIISDRTILLYAKDIDDYANERGYYFKFEELPFPIVKNNEELGKLKIKDVLVDHKKKYEKFRKEVGLSESGKATEKIVEIIYKNTAKKGAKK